MIVGLLRHGKAKKDAILSNTTLKGTDLPTNLKDFISRTGIDRSFSGAYKRDVLNRGQVAGLCT